MLTLYLVCFVLGGALLGLSLLGGDADADVDVTTDVDVSADADVAVDGDVSGDSDVDADGEGFLAAVRFLSLRNLVFFTAFFGLTGTLLTLSKAAPSLTLVAALGLGASAALAVDRAMAFLRHSESGALPSLGALSGARARVVVGIDAARPGKISVVTEERTHQLVARRHDKAALDHFEAGDTVVIVRFQDGIALVAEPTFLV